MFVEKKNIISNLEEMRLFAHQIAPLIKVGDVIALNGNLGVGKTTFSQSLIAALGYDLDVSSPSYSIVHYYEPPEIKLPLAHADFYRLNNHLEIEELGIYDFLVTGAAVIEWAGDYVDKDDPQYLEINIQKIGNNIGEAVENIDDILPREIMLNLGSDWVSRWT